MDEKKNAGNGDGQPVMHRMDCFKTAGSAVLPSAHFRKGVAMKTIALFISLGLVQTLFAQ